MLVQGVRVFGSRMKVSIFSDFASRFPGFGSFVWSVGFRSAVFRVSRFWVVVLSPQP